MKIYLQYLLLILIYLFDNQTDENIIKMSFNAIRKPFKLQRSVLENHFFNLDLTKKNNTNISVYERDEANLCKDLLTLRSKS